MDGLARQVVSQAEPAVRRIIQEERSRLAESMLHALPFLSLAAIAAVVTTYLVPPSRKVGKTIGYVTAAGLGAVGSWLGVQRLAANGAPPKPPTGPTVFDPVIDKTAKAIVTAAEPGIRSIVEDERARIAAATQRMLPFGVAALASFLVTMFAVEDTNRTMKAVGYSGSAVLFGAGTWLALEKEKEKSFSN